MLSEVPGNRGHAPANVTEAHHLQPITGAGGQSYLAGTLSKVVALLVSQGYAVHAP